jgi:DnaJ-class molecular chaperone
MASPNCPKCYGKGMVKEENGSVHTCFDCLLSGEMDQHDENVKDAGIRI